MQKKNQCFIRKEMAHTPLMLQKFSGVNAIRSAGSSPGKEVEACIPPLAEVADYCRKRKNGVSAESFIDYYKSIGWKRNGEIITDWKAALRSWEKQEKESNPRSKNKFNNFHQRSYDYDELEKLWWRQMLGKGVIRNDGNGRIRNLQQVPTCKA